VDGFLNTAKDVGWIIALIVYVAPHLARQYTAKDRKVEELYERLLVLTEKMLLAIEKNSDALEKMIETIGTNSDAVEKVSRVVQQLVIVVDDLEGRVCEVEKRLQVDRDQRG